MQVWSIDPKDKKLVTYYTMQMFRPVSHLYKIAKLTRDTFVFGYASGEFDVFEVRPIVSGNGRSNYLTNSMHLKSGVSIQASQ